MTAGQVRDYTGAEALLGSLPKADWLLADRVYDAGWFREALKENGTKPCIPGRKSRGKPIKHDKRRNRIEIIFGRLKDRQRAPERRAVATLVTRDMGICLPEHGHPKYAQPWPWPVSSVVWFEKPP